MRILKIIKYTCPLYKLIFISLLIPLLAGCTAAGMVIAEEPAHRVNIDGRTILVKQLPETESEWAAHCEEAWNGNGKTHDYFSNIQAIEKHTGCRVIENTINHDGAVSTASVICGE
jgi:hypothetical protein